MAFNRLADSQSKQLAALSVEHGGDTALTVNIGVSDGGAGGGIPGPLGGPESDGAFGLGSSLKAVPLVGTSLQQCPLPTWCLPSATLNGGDAHRQDHPGLSASNSPPRGISLGPAPPIPLPDRPLSQVNSLSSRERQATLCNCSHIPSRALSLEDRNGSCVEDAFFPFHRQEL